MSLLPDTAHLRTRALFIDTEADDLSSRCRALRAATSQTRWVSLAASRYRAQAEDVCADLDTVASELHHAAAALRAHADSVDRIVHVALSLPADAIHDGTQLASDGMRVAASLIGVR
jgi:hypothetical protein